jgi:hypothetical protein
MAAIVVQGMDMIFKRCGVLGLLTLLAGGPALAADLPVIPPVVPPKGKPGTPVELFNGKDLTGWTWHSATTTSKIDDVWSVKDGVLHCVAKPTGYIMAEKEYKNFIFTLEYRHLTNANGGTFICITGEPKVWPDAIQIQGFYGKVGDLINQNSGMKNMTTDPARTKTVNKDVQIARITPVAPAVAEKPMGEWNTLVITMEDGNLSVTNNSVLLNTAKDVQPAAGKVGVQAEGAVMEFKKVELTPLE